MNDVVGLRHLFFKVARWASNAAVLVLVATSLLAPAIARAAAPRLEGLSAEMVIGGGNWLWETKPGTWAFNLQGQYKEVERNESGILLQATTSTLPYRNLLIDFSKMAVTNAQGTTAYFPIETISSTSGQRVSYVEMFVWYPASSFSMAVTFSEATNGNGTPVEWVATAKAGTQNTITRIPLSQVFRNPASIEWKVDSKTYSFDPVSGTCKAPEPGFSCRVVRASSANGGNVGAMTVRLRGQLATLTKVNSSGVWRIEGEAGRSADYMEHSRRANSIDLVVGGSTPGRLRLYVDGSKKTEAAAIGSEIFAANGAMTVESAEPQWPGQLGTILEPLTPEMSPGFQIRNATDFPVLVTLEQVGCLYYQIVPPGQVFHRNTGAVWFTIRASMAANLQEPTVESCIRQPAIYAATVVVAGVFGAVTGGLAVPAMLAAAAGQGAAITFEVSKQSSVSTAQAGQPPGTAVTTLSNDGSAVGMSFTSSTTQTMDEALERMRALAQDTGYRSMAGDAGYSAEKLAVKQTRQEEIEAMKVELVQEAVRGGAYAGYPWPWPKAERVMPQYEISGGPRIRTFKDGTTVFLKQTRPLTITRVNNPY